MAEVFGGFVDAASHGGESLTIDFAASARSMKERWSSGRLSADFLAGFSDAYFSSASSASSADDLTGERLATLRDSVSFTVNELVENALKYAYRPAQEGHRVTLQLHSNGVRLYQLNRVDPAAIDVFRHTIGRLLTETPADLYEEQVTRNADEAAPAQSGLGLLTILDAHNATLAWKFEDEDVADRGILVTTMVSLHI